MVEAATDATNEQTPRTGRLIPDDVWGILTVWAESRGEPYEGMLAVAATIRHRTAKQWFSDGTVAGTVLTPYQFSAWNTGDAQRVRVAKAQWTDVTDSARAWFESEYNDPVPEALWYYADYVNPTWAHSNEMEVVKRIGRHIFLRPVVRA